VVEPVETTGARYLRQAQVPVIRLRMFRWLSLSKPLCPVPSTSSGTGHSTSEVPVVELVETTGARFLRQAQVPVIRLRMFRWLSLSKPPRAGG
jgi:hypothetical protein